MKKSSSKEYLKNAGKLPKIWELSVWKRQNSIVFKSMQIVKKPYQIQRMFG